MRLVAILYGLSACQYRAWVQDAQVLVVSCRAKLAGGAWLVASCA